MLNKLKEWFKNRTGITFVMYTTVSNFAKIFGFQVIYTNDPVLTRVLLSISLYNRAYNFAIMKVKSDASI